MQVNQGRVQSLVGAIASLPAGVPATGSRYKCTDSPYEYISNGSAWVPYAFGFQVTEPKLANFTQVNVDLSTFDTTHGGIIWSATDHAAANDLQYIGAAIPGAFPYFVDVAYTLFMGQTSGGFGPGIFSGIAGGDKIEFGGYGYAGAVAGKFQWASFTNNTTFSAAGGNFVPSRHGPLVWMRIQDDNTNLTYYMSPNGVTWSQLYQHARTSFLTPADCGLVMNSYNALGVAHILHYSAHN